MSLFKTKEFCSFYHRPQNIIMTLVYGTGTIKMTYVTKAYRDQMCFWKREEIPHACLLYKKYARKHFIQLKTIDFNVRRIPLMVRLTSTYYAFGCKKHICKKCHFRYLYGCTAGTCVACKKNFL